MKTTKEFRKRMIIALVVFICGVSLIGLIYIVNNKPFVYINPGIMTSASSSAVRPIETVRLSRQLKPYMPSHAANYTRSMQHSFGVSLPTQPMRGMYETSRAVMQNIGGGGTGGFAVSTGSRGSSSRRIQFGSGGGVVMPLATFTAMASTREVAPPEAKQAPQMARMAVAPLHAPGPPNPGGGGDLPGEHQLVEQPVGDAMLPLLMLLGVYCGILLIRRNKQLKN